MSTIITSPNIYFFLEICYTPKYMYLKLILYHCMSQCCFIVYTFGSVIRQALWIFRSHYGIPDKLISIIKVLYSDLSVRVICGSNLSEEFKLKTGVKQGYLLSPLLFTFCIDWVMRETTKNKQTGISWTMSEMVEDLDFADDIALSTISSTSRYTRKN